MSRRRRIRTNAVFCDKADDDGQPCDGQCLATTSRIMFTYFKCQKCGKTRKVPRSRQG